MTASEIDRLSIDWLRHNCDVEIASQYMVHSLAIPMLNHPTLIEALERLKQALCEAFGPDESFGTTDYREARAKLGLPADETLIPEVFIKAFT